jgi:hypothetical protein
VKKRVAANRRNILMRYRKMEEEEEEEEDEGKESKEEECVKDDSTDGDEDFDVYHNEEAIQFFHSLLAQKVDETRKRKNVYTKTSKRTLQHQKRMKKIAAARTPLITNFFQCISIKTSLYFFRTNAGTTDIFTSRTAICRSSPNTVVKA